MSDDKRLGRGLESLIPPAAEATSAPTAPSVEIVEAPVDQIRANPYQPREALDEAQIEELTASIRGAGILQPIVVRREADGYVLISGARRLRAARMAGLSHVPAVVRQVDDTDMLVLALIENLQRADLNPIEKARGFRDLQERFGLTQEQVSQKVGVDRSTVANFLRLLDLPERIRDDVSRGTISMGHARALLALGDAGSQLALAERIVNEGLSVRDVEKAVAGVKQRPSPQRKAPHVTDLENRLRERFEAKVDVVERSGKGKLIIHFADLDQLDRILSLLGM